ncbi:MAG: M42 family peptidase, partial [Caldiserica bacterium]
DEKLFGFFSEFMNAKNIEFQIGVTGGSTDASIVETEGLGYHSIPLCFPLRYTHSTVEVVSLKDGEILIRLLYELATIQIKI